MQQIDNILQSFDPVTLEEMDSVKLMNRLDMKYTFQQEKLPQLLEELKKNYRILVINGCRSSRYESLYFDTNDFDLYHRHHSGRLNRYKVRFRRYVESNLHYFEIKFKNNKGRTLKNRIRQQHITESIEGQAKDFLTSNSTLNHSRLEPKLWVNFSRITLVHKTVAERVTIDTGLSFRNNETEKLIPNLVIAEVKQDKSAPSDFVRLMRNNYIRQGSISKYCFGVSSLFKQRYNNFKPQIQIFNKITR